jgi:hypothetical protein
MISSMHYNNVLNNTIAVVQFTGKKPDTTTLRRDYFNSLNEIQNYKFYFNTESDKILLVTNIKDPFIQPTVKYFTDLVELNHENYFSQTEAKHIESNIVTSMKLIDKHYPELSTSILRLVGCFLLIKKKGMGSASSPISVGAVWLNPSETWQEIDYAEAILHESIHQSIYLDDMVNEIYAKSLDEMASVEGLVTSSIRKTKRSYDRSFQAACVLAVLVDFYSRLNMLKKVDELYQPLTVTLEELRSKDKFLTNLGKHILNELECISEYNKL